ncbi:PspC domain-containing protein [Nocardia sp. BMG51109]|uniref:PspC domain-containing protein n=1 Tax=Nocardia sp. BMG51109 TaxID=1056816 RepID=UPI000463817A|nr:PspC domain-containing protein [Nocardia sp. BMG51109]
MTRHNGGTGGTGRMGFNDQLHHLWRTRPLRLPRQSPVAGVAAGFGRRYGVDPVLVRVVFVVATIFGGTGVVLYLVAWLLLPAAGDQVSATEGLFGRGQSSQSPTKTVVLLVALAIAASTMGPVGVGLGGSGLISLALMLAGWWLLYLRQPEPPADGYDQLLAEGGVAPTGYPGAMFPGATPWPGPTYGPYTRLPDHYEPDQPKDASGQGLSTTAPSTAPVSTTPLSTTPPDGTATDVLSRPQSDERQDDTGVLRADPPAESAAADATTDSGTAQRNSAADAPESDSTTEVLPGKEPPPTGEPGGGQSIPSFPPAPDARTRTVPGPAHPGPTPPGWDPLGVAPLAWTLPDPAPAAPVAVPAAPQRRPRSRLTAIVIGLAILAAAVAGALAAAGVDWMTPGRVGAVALAVVGLGLIAGAFLRRGYGLMVVLAPLAGFVILASMVGPVEFDRAAMGEHTWTPATVADLNPDYRVNIGSGTLDLHSLALTENRTVNVSVQMGDFRVLVPESMRVQANCTADMGEVACPPGLTGPAGGPVLTVNVDVHAGNAEVKRG